MLTNFLHRLHAVVLPTWFCDSTREIIIEISEVGLAMAAAKAITKPETVLIQGKPETVNEMCDI
jgi:hypothetical protein